MKLFIFGATGDLVRRKVMPAFAALRRGKPAFSDLEIIALGRKDLDTLDLGGLPVKYEKVEFGENLTCEGCESHLDKDETAYFYSALPPSQIELVLRYVAAVIRDNLPAQAGHSVRLLLEQPLGR